MQMNKWMEHEKVKATKLEDDIETGTGTDLETRQVSEEELEGLSGPTRSRPPEHESTSTVELKEIGRSTATNLE